MNKRTALYIFALILLALFLIGTKRIIRNKDKPNEKVQGLARSVYVIPPLVIEPWGVQVPGEFDWMNGEQCGCDGGRIDALIIDSVGIAPRVQSGYNFIGGSLPYSNSPTLSVPELAALESVTPKPRVASELKFYWVVDVTANWSKGGAVGYSGTSIGSSVGIYGVVPQEYGRLKSTDFWRYIQLSDGTKLETGSKNSLWRPLNNGDQIEYMGRIYTYDKSKTLPVPSVMGYKSKTGRWSVVPAVQGGG